MTDVTSQPRRTPFVRVRDWLVARPGLVDAVLAAVLWVLTCSVLLITLTDTPGPGVTYPPAAPVWVSLLVLAAGTLQVGGLAWRRTRPDLSFALVVAGHLGQLALGDSPLPSNIAALMSAYAVARYSQRPWVRRCGLVIAAVAGLAATLDWSGYSDMGTVSIVGNTIFISGMALVCWLAGDLTRKRRELVSRLREQNEALRRDRDQRARLAAQDERTRIAREMHDIVAHSLSVVVVQADGAAYAAEHGSDFEREHARRALTTIGTTAREALAETRRLVGVLRTTEDDGREDRLAEYTPTETLADLPALVDRIAATGMDVSLEDSVGGLPVPRESGLAAYRIVQESLTNVIKHAGPDARVRVSLTAGQSLRVEVRDDGRGAAAPDDGHGHGLIGMRERAASVGGTMTAGPGRAGGYVVTATLPLDQETSS